jgi:hypothetical protein
MKINRLLDDYTIEEKIREVLTEHGSLSWAALRWKMFENIKNLKFIYDYYPQHPDVEKTIREMDKEGVISYDEDLELYFIKENVIKISSLDYVAQMRAQYVSADTQPGDKMR